MRIGISCYDIHALDLVELAVAAERAGFDSIWLGEHVVAPIDYGSHHPTQPGDETAHASSNHNGKPIVDPSVELLDPLVVLAAVAARTSTLGLATGVYLLPLRHPLIAARAAATLADVSAGRVRLGIGSGWLREEFAALDVPFTGRTARTEEALAILRLAWAGGPFEFHGHYYDFNLLQITPRPVGVPLVLGGNTEAALRRAVAFGDGWFSSGIPTLEQARVLRERLGELHRELSRTDPLPTTWRVASADADLVAEYAAEGFDELLVMQYDVWRGESIDERREYLAKSAAALGLVGVGS